MAVTLKQHTHSAEERGHELTILNAITAAAGSSLTSAHVLSSITNVLFAELDLPAGAIIIHDRRQSTLVISQTRGLSTLPDQEDMPNTLAPYNDVIIGRKPVQLPARTLAGFNLSDHEWRSCLVVPLQTEEHVHALLVLLDHNEHTFQDAHMSFYGLLGDQVGAALRNANLFEEVRASRERTQMLSRRLVEVQEAERRHVARELHDEVGQTLTGLKLVLEMIERLPADQMHKQVAQACDLVNELMGRVRNLSLDLRPAMLDDFGLVAALLWHIERYRAQTQIEVRFTHGGADQRFPPQIETAAYRIIQEALTNIARHAGVQEASVHVWVVDGILSLAVEDKGQGFDPQQAIRAANSSGLAGMYERAALLGGRLLIESIPSDGTRLTAELPLAGWLERRTREQRA